GPARVRDRLEPGPSALARPLRHARRPWPRERLLAVVRVGLDPSRSTVNPSRLATAAALLFCTLWLFAPVVFGRQVFFERDAALFWHAQTDATVRAVGQGSLPWWDPNLSFGEPLVEYPAQVFYPPFWPALLVPAGLFFACSVVAHHLFGGAGLYLLLRGQRLSRLASA